MEAITTEQIQDAKIKALQALRNQPSTYYIKVIDETSLPAKLKGKDKIAFVVKVPTLSVLSEIAIVIESLPASLFSGDVAMTKEAMENVPAIIQMIAILAHGNSKKQMPDWYVPFLSQNLTLDESLMLWHECAMKLKTDFFLPFFQGAKMMNPMGMNLPNPKDSTHLD